MAHSVPSASSTSPAVRTAVPEEPSVGSLVQSAMADVSTLVRGEIELAKTEIGTSAKRAGLSVAFFGVAGVMALFAGIFFFIALAEFLAWLGVARWISYLIVFGLLLLIAGLAALVGVRKLKKIKKPERTLETLSDLPDVLRREAPGERHRAVPEVSEGRVKRRGAQSYTL